MGDDIYDRPYNMKIYIYGILQSKKIIKIALDMFGIVNNYNPKCSIRF